MALLEIGQVARPHGLTGEVVVALVTNRLERLAAGSHLRAQLPGGEVRDLEVIASRPHQRRHLVRFVGYRDHAAAESLRGARLLGEEGEEGEDFFVHHLIGAELVDQHGKHHGPVLAVEANPASDLLVVATGYVPARFIVALEGGVVRVEIPEGLLD
jgi:16S rRNA processing protein RimM